ncbi:acetyl-CoA carboxylase biotin carboxyl carrier protein [Haematospirillum sp. 15-248]|uniref:acetyl-CoA carboxylase biotin carboxyl carrier protein n=1 Tax=Haematospirillum sp. 15-248 TaxID=2723107 RepID=UPI00143B5938|nr:acetyl-CoA carboxylase biotin carboxyl carrier protein subunit [Haematospirillum sp. 15-248]NKD86847.1 acetyl-CoA carboxylase biotin carboxyl carrier protein [Haematospirillum sp. 15-248]
MSKTTIDSEAIRQLASLLDDTGLHEIEYETEALRIRVGKAATVVTHAAPAAAPLAAPATRSTADEPQALHPGTVVSKMVGVAYLAPGAGEAPFVSVGQTVSQGQTLMLIEAMKTYTPVTAHCAGRVVQILVSDKQPVEHGEPLAIIE